MKLYLTSINLFSFIRFLFTIPHSAIFILSFPCSTSSSSTLFEFLFLASAAAFVVAVRIVYFSSALHILMKRSGLLFRNFVFFFALPLSRPAWLAQHLIHERITATATHTIQFVYRRRLLTSGVRCAPLISSDVCIRTRNERKNIRHEHFYCFCSSILFSYGASWLKRGRKNKNLFISYSHSAVSRNMEVCA